MGDRGSGVTTKQIREAPRGAIYIWCNGQLAYPRDLAKKLGREDLEIVSPAWLQNGWQGRELAGIVVDHAAWLDDEDHSRLLRALPRVRRSEGKRDGQ